MAKKSLIDLTKTNRTIYKSTPWGAEPNELKKPQVLLSVYVNAEGNVEEVKILDEFVGGSWGDSLRRGDSEDFDFYDLPNECDEKDCLYHIYAAMGSYRCSWEYDEYDIYHEFFKVIKVMTNYSKFLDGIEDWEDQQRKRAEDEGMSVMTSGRVYGKDDEDYEESDLFTGGSHLRTNLTMRDLKDLIENVAKFDIRLAHRYALHYELKSALGDQYDSEIEKMEKIRQELIEYIKYGRDFETRWNSEGYEITSKSYRFPEGTHTITFKEINEIPDDILIQNDSKKILEAIVATKKIIDVFDKSL